MRKYVSQSFREFVLQKYPNLSAKPAHLRFFRYLCFGDFFDDKTDRLVIPCTMIAEDCCLTPWDRNFNGKDFLLTFQRDVLPALRWSEHQAFSSNSWGGKARTIDVNGFDDE